MNELRYTIKLIFKNIRFSLLCISVIAIGVGMILPFYALVQNLGAKELPFDQGDRYIVLKKTLSDPGQRQGGSLYDAFHYNYFRDNSASFRQLGAWRDMPASISDGEYSESYRGAEVEPALLSALGVQPLLGRLFSEEDALFDSTPVAILSYESWQSYYAANEEIIGQLSSINGEMKTIIGVMPEAFGFPIFHELWLPLYPKNDVDRGEEFEDLSIVGILADNTDISVANQEIQLLQAQIKSISSDEYEHIGSTQVEYYTKIVNGQTNGIEYLFVIIITLITLNAGNLFFVRGEERLQELAIRSALGADYRRIAQALMLESFFISFVGLLFGLILARLGMAYLDGMFGSAGGLADIFWWDMSLNGDLIITSLFVTSLVWIMSGGLPAWRISRTNINDFVTGGGKGITEGGATRINKILVNSQLVLGCVLLTFGAFTVFLYAGTITTLVANSENLYTGYVNTNGETAGGGQRTRDYRLTLEQSLINQPGISGATFTTAIPGTGGSSVPYRSEQQDLLDNDAYPTQYLLSVANNYFDLFGIEVVQGRGFGFDDEYSSLAVAIVDQNLADSLWPDESVIGKRIQLNPAEDAEWLTIVGVVASRTQESSLLPGQSSSSVLYRPIQQANPPAFWVVFSSNDPSIDYRRTLGIAAGLADQDLPLTRVNSLLQIQETRISEESININLGIGFMVVALYLTGITTYGLAARITSRRRTEIGVRMAMGARQIDCLRVILKDGFLTVLFGLVLGGTLAILGTYAVLTSSPIFIGTFDILIPVTLTICLSMGGLVMLANYFPARKIVGLEPGEALHYE